MSVIDEGLRRLGRWMIEAPSHIAMVYFGLGAWFGAALALFVAGR